MERLLSVRDLSSGPAFFVCAMDRLSPSAILISSSDTIRRPVLVSKSTSHWTAPKTCVRKHARHHILLSLQPLLFNKMGPPPLRWPSPDIQSRENSPVVGNFESHGFRQRIFWRAIFSLRKYSDVRRVDSNPETRRAAVTGWISYKKIRELARRRFGARTALHSAICASRSNYCFCFLLRV
jgi:hypothetical protein